MSNLLVSGFVTNPGLYSVDTHTKAVTQLDSIPSTGVINSQWGIFRARFSRSEMLIDRIVDDQIVSTFDISGGWQPHGLSVDDHSLIVVDTGRNRILWLNPLTGEINDSWSPLDVPDAWHMNSLRWNNSILYVSCFGRFNEQGCPPDKGWWGKGVGNYGEVLEVKTGVSVLSGLSAPHSPVFIGSDDIVVCESYISELVWYTNGEKISSVVLGGWPRGLHIDGVTVWVGVSDSGRVPSSPPPHGITPGKVVAVDLPTFEIIDEIEMPCSGIFDIVRA